MKKLTFTFIVAAMAIFANGFCETTIETRVMKESGSQVLASFKLNIDEVPYSFTGWEYFVLFKDSDNFEIHRQSLGYFYSKQSGLFTGTFWMPAEYWLMTNKLTIGMRKI